LATYSCSLSHFPATPCTSLRSRQAGFFLANYGARIYKAVRRSQYDSPCAPYEHCETAGPLVDALLRRGYISRVPDKSDRRLSIVTITEGGEALYSQFLDKLSLQCYSLFKDYSDDSLRELSHSVETVLNFVGHLQKTYTSGEIIGTNNVKNIL